MLFALNEFRRLDFNQVDAEVWQKLLLHPLSQQAIIQWINEDAIVAAKLDMDYWHALAYEPDWQASDYIQQLKRSDEINKNWQKQLAFDEDLASTVRTWLADVRRFAPIDLGFDWLMSLARSEQSVYREFAIGRINKGFLPADFVAFFDNADDNANNKNNSDKKASAQTIDAATAPVEVDLTGQRYLFTGKMQSMTRGDAEKLVKAANGEISGAVNAKLDYLVIGDDGSPLYGSGRKGSKQLKAEELIASGVALKIISETAFLQMLSGQSREVSSDDTAAGAEALWHMATDDPTAPISELAISYLSHHHEQICMALTDRPVDPDALIPAEFFSAERVIPLLTSPYSQLRAFGLLLSEYELAHWQPTPELWLSMAESSHNEVTELLKRALLDKPSLANRRYHVDSATLSSAMLNTFIASKKRVARQLGITLLQRYSKFQNVQALYVLTQSTDREVRYAAVTMLWQHYKARHISPNWQPANSKLGNAKTNNAQTAKKDTSVENIDAVKQSPSHSIDNLPATAEQLLSLLRRGLFELPPGRLGNITDSASNSTSNIEAQRSQGETDKQHSAATLRTISASQAKLALIETFRDVGLSDKSFATLIMPTLFTFTHSAGKMERHECLVAVTRLLHRYPELSAHLAPS